MLQHHAAALLVGLGLFGVGPQLLRHLSQPQLPRQPFVLLQGLLPLLQRLHLGLGRAEVQQQHAQLPQAHAAKRAGLLHLLLGLLQLRHQVQQHHAGHGALCLGLQSLLSDCEGALGVSPRLLQRLVSLLHDSHK